MALTKEQADSIIRATIKMHQKGKLLNLDKRRYAREAKAQTSSRPQPDAINSAPPPKPKTPNATG